MRKNCKMIVCFIIFLGTIFMFNQNIFAVDKFPDTITPVRKNLITGKGWNLYQKEYSSTDPKNAGKAFCTAFHKYAPTSGSCRKTGWSSKSDISERVSVAIGSLIAKARPSSGAMSWDSYYYAELAINQFLYDGYTNKKGYGVSYNNVASLPATIKNNASFKSYLATAKYEYENYKNTKISISSTKFNADTKTATALVTCTDYKGSKIACNITDKKVTATLDGTALSGVNITASKNSDNKTYTLTATLPQYDTSRSLKIQLSATDKQCWNTAQNYNCGDIYQSLTPNLLKAVCHTKSASANITKNGEDPDKTLTVSKVDENAAALEGALVYITKDDNQYLDGDGYAALSKMTVDGQEVAGIRYSNIEAGTYCITEVKSPIGYKISEGNYCVTINNDSPDGTITIVNNKNTQNLTIKKVDEKGNPVKGAKLKVYRTKIDALSSGHSGNSDDDTAVDVTNADMEVIAEWTTDGTDKVISGLSIGETYTVVEDEIPNGYAGGITSQDITIKEGENVVTLTNTQSSITVSKQSITSSKELPGAQLTITSAQGEVVANWTSTDKPQEITGLADGDYTLTETTAPQGYTVAESINFTIENGKLKDDSDNTLVMKDATIVDVPDTLSVQNIITMFAGLLLVGLGSGVLFYEAKRKKKA